MICRKQATIYRVTKKGHTYLCDNPDCDFECLVRYGVIKETVSIKKEDK